MPRLSRKNSRFLGEEEAEAGQVHLLLVHLDLREVRVVREVGGQVLGQPELDVETDVARAVVHDRVGQGVDVGGEAPDGVGLDLQDPVAARHLHARQRRSRRDAEHPGTARDGHAGQVGPLVLAPDGPRELQPPELRLARLEAERLEGDARLDRPPPVEAARPRVPDGVPVVVRVALVGDLVVEEAAERVDHEGGTVPAVVERVERQAEGVVLDELERVALHLVGDPLRLGGGIPDARGDVDVLRVEEDPRLGLLGGRRALDRQLLEEVADGGHDLVDAFIEHAVDPQRFVHANRTHRRPAGGIARDGGGRHRAEAARQ